MRRLRRLSPVPSGRLVGGVGRVSLEPVKVGRTFLGLIADSFELCRGACRSRASRSDERPAVVPNGAGVDYGSFAPC